MAFEYSPARTLPSRKDADLKVILKEMLQAFTDTIGNIDRPVKIKDVPQREYKLSASAKTISVRKVEKASG